MARRRPVGAIDNIWLNADRAHNLMVIDAIVWFDEWSSGTGSPGCCRPASSTTTRCSTNGSSRARPAVLADSNVGGLKRHLEAG